MVRRPVSLELVFALQDRRQPGADVVRDKLGHRFAGEIEINFAVLETDLETALDPGVAEHLRRIPESGGQRGFHGLVECRNVLDGGKNGDPAVRIGCKFRGELLDEGSHEFGSQRLVGGGGDGAGHTFFKLLPELEDDVARGLADCRLGPFFDAFGLFFGLPDRRLGVGLRLRPDRFGLFFRFGDNPGGSCFRLLHAFFIDFIEQTLEFFRHLGCPRL